MFGPSAVTETVRGLWALSEMLKQISYVGHDITYFKLETRALSQLLNMFYHTVKESTENLENNKKRQRLVDSLFRQFTIAKESIRSLVDKLVVPFSKTQSSLSGFAIRFRWYMKKEAVASLRLQLESVKASASLFLNMTVCEDLRRRIRELESQGLHVPEEMTERVQHFVKVVILDRSAAEEAIREVVSFQKSHKNLKNTFRSEALSLRKVESAIQKEIDEVLPEACRSNHGRGKRHKHRQNTPTHFKRRTSAEQSQVSYDSDRQYRTPRQVSPFGRYPEQQFTRRSPVQFQPLSVPSTSSRSSRSSPSSPQSTQSGWTGSQRILTPQKSTVDGKLEMGNTVRGCRVRDNGRTIHDEIGPWPKEVVDSHRENFYLNENTMQDGSTVSSQNSRLERNHQKRKSSPQDRQSSPEDSDVLEDAPSGIKVTGKVLRRRPQINYRNMQPLPPFNTVDQDEKHRRQSELRESDSE